MPLISAPIDREFDARSLLTFVVSLVSVLSGSTRQVPPLAIVGITPTYSIQGLAGKSVEVIKQYFLALRQKQQDFFPFLHAVDKKFVCTPMDSGMDPLGPPSASIKHVGAAYVDFMVRLIQSQQHAPRGCVCFFGLLAPCLSVSVCVLLRTGLCSVSIKSSQRVVICACSCLSFVDAWMLC